ncbi:MAG: hypothetical protein SWH61_06520 [Thermodesulfobacteriota bacterium]|nr:hypothetical protein [Thermodesulfobacteriota bacterium]
MYQRIGFVEGETKAFAHLPFDVTFMEYRLAGGKNRDYTGNGQ